MAVRARIQNIFSDLAIEGRRRDGQHGALDRDWGWQRLSLQRTAHRRHHRYGRNAATQMLLHADPSDYFWGGRNSIAFHHV
jgi:hypothetical protein